jgi:hypothetical protein
LRKLQGFFGEEFPGRDSSEISLPHPGAGKEHRSHSYSHTRPHRDRNLSNATDHGRDGSPSSRPRTPVPAPEVVPFLYQEPDVRATPLPPLASDYLCSAPSFFRQSAPIDPPNVTSVLSFNPNAECRNLGHRAIWRRARPGHSQWPGS